MVGRVVENRCWDLLDLLGGVEDATDSTTLHRDMDRQLSRVFGGLLVRRGRVCSGAH